MGYSVTAGDVRYGCFGGGVFMSQGLYFAAVAPKTARQKTPRPACRACRRGGCRNFCSDFRCPSARLFSFHRFGYPFVCLSVPLFADLSVCLTPIRLTDCLSAVCPPVNLPFHTARQYSFRLTVNAMMRSRLSSAAALFLRSAPQRVHLCVII